ncbi:MAG: hypothetical protein KAH23_05765, partial [Kiritimatiellae bacterium]|nr:hypothetical protein [Kiritimatiellia bacterium]
MKIELNKSLRHASRRMIGVVIAGMFLAMLTSAVGEDAIPDYKHLVFMGHPKDGGRTVDTGYVRNWFTETFEPYWREVSYHKSDPNSGITTWGYYPDTKSFGYADLPWRCNPAGQTLTTNIFFITNNVVGTLVVTNAAGGALGYDPVWSSLVHPFLAPKGPVSFGGEHNWEVPPVLVPGILHSENIPGAAALVDGYWTPGERFLDVNNDDQWDPVLYDETYWMNGIPKIDLPGTVYVLYEMITNAWDGSLVMPGYRDDLRALGITNIPPGDLVGSGRHGVRGAVDKLALSPGELFADYSSIEIDTPPAFDMSVRIYIANTNIGVYTNVVVYINELDLSPDLYSFNSNEGDLEHIFVNGGDPAPALDPVVMNIPINGVLDFYWTPWHGAFYEQAFRLGNSNDLVYVTYQAWVYNPNHPNPPDYLDFYKPEHGINCQDPAQIPYGTVNDWKLIWVEVPVYIASELMGEYYGKAGDANLYRDFDRRNHAHEELGAFMNPGYWDLGHEEEPYQDFLSWYIPLSGLPPARPGAFLMNVSGSGWLTPFPNHLSSISQADYIAYINNNYPGDTAALIARAGNDQYDGPDNWVDMIDNKMELTSLVPILTTPMPGTMNGSMYWDPRGEGMSWNSWWAATFNSAPPNDFAGVAGSWWIDGGAIPNCTPHVTDNQQSPSRTLFVTNILDGTVVTNVITDDPTWRPALNSSWGYDSPREFQDMPSSIHHLGNVGRRVGSAYSADPYPLGGDLRLGEVTSPNNESIYGEDIGWAPFFPFNGTYPEDMRFGEDDMITPAGPYATKIHGNAKYDAGNLMSVELATWRLDGQSLTGPRSVHAGTGWSLIRYGGDHRDVNLDGLIDQGETIRAGAANYFVDDYSDTKDGGVISEGSIYPFSWDRYAEDILEVWDYSEDFLAIVNNNRSASGIEAIIADIPSAPLANAAVGTALAQIKFARAPGSAPHATFVAGDYAWIDVNNNNLYDGDFLLSTVDPSGALLAGTTADALVPNVRYRDRDGSGGMSIGDDVWVDADASTFFDSEVVLAENSGQLMNGETGNPIGHIDPAVIVVFHDNDASGAYSYGDDVWMENRWPGYTGGSAMTYDSDSNDVSVIASSSLTNGTPADGVIPNVVYSFRGVASDVGYVPGQDDMWIDAGATPGVFESEEILYRTALFAYWAVSLPQWMTNGTPGQVLADVYYQENGVNVTYQQSEDDAWVDYAAPLAQYGFETLVSPSVWVAVGYGRFALTNWVIPNRTIADGPVPDAMYEDRDGDLFFDIQTEPAWVDANNNGLYDAAFRRMPIYFVGWNDGVSPWTPSPSGSVFDSQTEDMAGPISGFIQVQTWHDSLGVLCHEQGHDIFGWPDLYDYDISAVGVYNQPIGQFDLMATGGLVHGIPPMKSMVGWIRPVNLGNILVEGAGVQTLLMYPVDNQANRNQYFYWTDPVNGPNEVYWFWYQCANNISGFPGTGSQGLHIEHDDYSGWQDSAVPPQQRYNPHPTWGMVQADGLDEMFDGVSAGGNDDVWPGATSNTTFSPFTDPEARWWNQIDIGLRITDVRLPDPNDPWGPVEVDFMRVNPALPWSWPESGDDSDNDGIPDVWEYHYFGDLIRAGV